MYKLINDKQKSKLNKQGCDCEINDEIVSTRFGAKEKNLINEILIFSLGSLIFLVFSLLMICLGDGTKKEDLAFYLIMMVIGFLALGLSIYKAYIYSRMPKIIIIHSSNCLWVYDEDAGFKSINFTDIKSVFYGQDQFYKNGEKHKSLNSGNITVELINDEKILIRSVKDVEKTANYIYQLKA